MGALQGSGSTDHVRESATYCAGAIIRRAASPPLWIKALPEPPRESNDADDSTSEVEERLKALTVPMMVVSRDHHRRIQETVQRLRLGEPAARPGPQILPRGSKVKLSGLIRRDDLNGST